MTPLCPLDDARSQRGDPTNGIPRAQECQGGKNVVAARGCPKPFAAEPEPSAFVTEQRSKTTGALPSAAAITTDGDRPGAGEDEHTSLSIERAEESGLSIRHHEDAPRETVQSLRQRPSLAVGPDTLGGHHERGHGAGRPLLALPDPA